MTSAGPSVFVGEAHSLSGKERTRTARAAVWSRYWAGGQPHSCPGSLDDRLSGDFARFWIGAAAPLNASERVLEIGAGNGALSRLIVESFCGEHPPSVEAIDLADVRPGWVAGLDRASAQRIRFHAQTVLERLPFDAGTFSLVVGQYAFEYAERTPALTEIARCSKRDARLVLVMHHAQSEVVRVAEAELTHLRWLLAPDGLYRAAESLVPDLVQARDPSRLERLKQDAGAEQRRQRYNTLQNELQIRATTMIAPDVLQEAAQGVARALESVLKEGEAPAQTLLGQQSSMLADSKQRLDELVDCALDEADLAQFETTLREAGYNRIETGTILTQGKLMGWRLVAARAGHPVA